MKVSSCGTHFKKHGSWLWFRHVNFAGHLVSILLVDWNVFPEKAMAPHSSAVAWKVSWAEEPGRLQYVGSLRVRHD